MPVPRQGSLRSRRSWDGTPFALSWPGSGVKIWEGLPWGRGRGQKLLDSGYYGYASYRDCPHGGGHTLAQLTQGSSGWVTCPPGPPKVGVGGHGSCVCTLTGDMTFVPEPGTWHWCLRAPPPPPPPAMMNAAGLDHPCPFGPHSLLSSCVSALSLVSWRPFLSVP